MKPPRILVHTLFTLFKRHSHPVHILLTKRTYLYINHGIRRREGMKEKIALPDVFPTFIRFSRTFPPLIFSSRQTVSSHLAGKAHCNAGSATHRHARITAPQCCKHRQLVLPTKLKPICTKSKFFTSLLLHPTSLDFTLSYLNNLFSSI